MAASFIASNSLEFMKAMSAFDCVYLGSYPFVLLVM